MGFDQPVRVASIGFWGGPKRSRIAGLLLGAGVGAIKGENGAAEVIVTNKVGKLRHA
jgi:hypothetical protein